MVRYVPSPAVSRSLDKWAAHQFAQSLQPRSVEERAQGIIRYAKFSGEDNPLKFTAENIERWIGQPRLSPGTRWTYGQHMRAFHLWLVKTKQRKDNPMDVITLPKKPQRDPRPIESYQLADLMRVAAVAQGRTRMMVLLAAFAGLRVHEIAKVDGKDFDPIAGTLRVEGKGRRKSTVALHQSIVLEAVNYPLKGLWFPNGRLEPGPLTRHHVSRMIREALDAAHVDATAHALRHTFATNLVNADVDMLTIQKLMRHSSPSSTAIYAEVNRVRRAEAVSRLTVPE